MNTEDLQDLYFKELRNVYSAAKLLVKTFPKMMDRAQLPELRQALANHLAETQAHTSRLEKIFDIHGEKPTTKANRAIQGILREAEDDMREVSDPSLRDAVIAAAAEQIAHYEIAAYGTLHAYSIHLGHTEDSGLLQKILDEERGEDRKLTEITLTHLKVDMVQRA